MLQSLHIVNFAIIEDTIIELTDGATVFTGATRTDRFDSYWCRIF